jgi:hypothetical protein
MRGPRWNGEHANVPWSWNERCVPLSNLLIPLATRPVTLTKAEVVISRFSFYVTRRKWRHWTLCSSVPVFLSVRFPVYESLWVQGFHPICLCVRLLPGTARARKCEAPLTHRLHVQTRVVIFYLHEWSERRKLWHSLFQMWAGSTWNIGHYLAYVAVSAKSWH